MIENPQISFIIPVYNVEPYIHKCVDRILNQDYQNMEIILVDDGSPDKCPQICDEYAEQNVKIRVIHQQNGGLSVARNTGIAAAKGEYICFVDSDDYWEPNVLGTLMEQIEREQLDVLRFDYQNVRIGNHGNIQISRPSEYAHLIEEKHEAVDGEMYLNKYMDFECYAWQFLLRRELAYGFMPGIHYEDIEWTPRMILGAMRVNSTPTIVYNYLIRSGSIAHPQGHVNGIRKNVDDIMVGMNTISKLMQAHPSAHWLHRLQSSIAYDILSMITEYLFDERERYIQTLYKIKAFPLTEYKTTRQGSRKIFIINHFGPYAYCRIMRYRKMFKRLLGKS